MTNDIKCAACESLVRLQALDRGGTHVACDCDDVRHSMDAVPYELEVSHLPDDWYVVESYPTGGEREERMRHYVG